MFYNHSVDVRAIVERWFGSRTGLKAFLLRKGVGTNIAQVIPTWRMKLILRRELPEPLWRRLKN